VWRTPGCWASAVGLCGPDAARFFYDEDHIRRHTAIPWPVQSTLFGHGAVHTLDGEHHRVRKSLFHAVVTPDATAGLLDDVAEAWDDAVASWPAGEPVVLFDEAARSRFPSASSALWRSAWPPWTTPSRTRT
jgi:fatty-acid peroxygenase